MDQVHLWLLNEMLVVLPALSLGQLFLSLKKENYRAIKQHFKGIDMFS